MAYLGLHYHLVFSTDDRVPHIHPGIIESVHKYLGGVVNGLGAQSRIVGGIEDHVHLLVSLKSTHTLANFMRELKKSSSMWIKRECGLPNFSWQESYFAVTVSPSARGDVFKYIQNQREHHRGRTFKEELIILLKKAGIEYDEKYLE